MASETKNIFELWQVKQYIMANVTKQLWQVPPWQVNWYHLII